MKTVDLTTPVMQKVVRFEARRIRLWLGRFVFALVVLIAVLLGSVVVAWYSFQERQTLDLLTLFTEDREIISEFWQDTIMVFWEESPQRALLAAAITIVGVLSIVWFTRKKRKIIGRKIREFARYTKTGHNGRKEV